LAQKGAKSKWSILKIRKTKMNEPKKIQCVERGCGEFEFSAKEQGFYAERGFPNPKRCKQHREFRKKEINKQKSPFHPKNWKKENHQ